MYCAWPCHFAVNCVLPSFSITRLLSVYAHQIYIYVDVDVGVDAAVAVAIAAAIILIVAVVLLLFFSHMFFFIVGACCLGFQLSDKCGIEQIIQFVATV